MKTCILIGGGDIGRANTSYTLKEIDEEIVKLTNKTNPTFLFIGLASNSSDSYYDTIKKNYQKLGCNTIYLKKSNLINNKDIVKNKIESADIIYIGGGDTIKLIERVQEYKLEKELIKAYERGCIMVGYSAGAILLSNKGFSDSRILRGESNNYEFINGLKLVNLIICPHFESDSEKEKELNEKIKEETYCLENNTALLIKENQIGALKSNKNTIYLLSKKDKKIIKKEWPNE